jgi:hypothetical protein
MRITGAEFAEGPGFERSRGHFGPADGADVGLTLRLSALMRAADARLRPISSGLSCDCRGLPRLLRNARFGAVHPRSSCSDRRSCDGRRLPSRRTRSLDRGPRHECDSRAPSGRRERTSTYGVDVAYEQGFVRSQPALGASHRQNRGAAEGLSRRNQQQTHLSILI